MDLQKKDYFSYLLRVYRSGSRTGWVASLENPQTGQKLVFSNLGQLFSYLEELCIGPANSALSGEYGSQDMP
jgi:hypothetical protein